MNEERKKPKEKEELSMEELENVSGGFDGIIYKKTSDISESVRKKIVPSNDE